MCEERWRFNLLGTFEVVRNNTVLAGVHRNKHCQVLAFLAYTSGQHARGNLSALFWPMSEVRSNNLSQAIGKLTRILELPELNEYTLLQNPGDGTLGLLYGLFTRDIDVFGQFLKEADKISDETAKIGPLTAAVRLYRGEFMLGYDAEEEYEWIARPRLDFRNKFVLALKTLERLFRKFSLTDLAVLCEEHIVFAAPLSPDECALLENWDKTVPAEPTVSRSPSATNRAARSVNLPKAITAYNHGRGLWKLRSEGALRESIR